MSACGALMAAAAGLLAVVQRGDSPVEGIAELANFDLGSFGRVCLAAVLGGLVGVEREWSDKPAGLRTHAFVAAGSALLVVLAKDSLQAFRGISPDHVIDADPIRIIQAIIIGISFLGAGTIVRRHRREIEGLTTAASVYVTAAVGIAVGLDRFALAIESAVFFLLLLLSARWLENKRHDPSSAAGELSQ